MGTIFETMMPAQPLRITSHFVHGGNCRARDDGVVAYKLAPEHDFKLAQRKKPVLSPVVEFSLLVGQLLVTIVLLLVFFFHSQE